MKGWTEKRMERQARKAATAEAWYEALSMRSVIKEITSANGALNLTGGLIVDQKTQAVVNAQVANLKATLILAKRLDRIIELLEASTEARDGASPEPDPS